MRVVFPDYYKEFSCKADQCEDTCCAGWQIMIDEHSMKRYQKALIANPYRCELWKAIKWREQCFRQDEQKRCAFLSKDNLCNLYIGMGKDSLCKTCRNYPRHIEEFENIREITLSLSCPEIARILLNKKEKVHFVEKYKETAEETFDDFDPFLYELLEASRGVMLEICQDRTLSIRRRCLKVAALAGDIQKAVEQGQMFGCETILEKYRCGTENCRKYRLKNAAGFSKRVFREMYQLERLRDDWEQTLLESAYWLHCDESETYQAEQKNFENWLSQNMSEFDIVCEQILGYFISTYFCGAVYDGRIKAKIWMSIISLFWLFELWKSCWLKNNRNLFMEDVIDITYRFSRELEHSEQNLEAIERFADCFFERI